MKIKALILISITALLSSCHLDEVCINGNNRIETVDLNVTDFDAIALQGAFNVVIRQGNDFDVYATGDANILSYLEAEVHGDVLELDLERGCYRNYDLTVTVTTPYINGVYLSGSGNINVGDFLDLDQMEVRISGSGNIDLHELGGLYQTNVEIPGSGNIEFNERTQDVDKAKFVITGSGNVNAFNLIAGDVYARIDGSGNIRTTAQDHLDAYIGGSGDILYKGNPIIRQHITGSGSVVDAN